MRPIGYLESIASRFPSDTKTLAVIDRAMAEAGLRRKGSGRAIPAPTLKEDLLFMLAIMGRRSVVSATEDAQAWANLPCISGCGAYFEKRRLRTLIECLEDLCLDITKPAGERPEEMTDALMLELDLTYQQATIVFGNKQKDHLLFDLPGIKRGYQGQLKAEIRAGYFVHLARSYRDEAAD